MLLRHESILILVEEWCSCNKARKMSNSIISDKIQTLKKELTIDIKQTNGNIIDVLIVICKVVL